jgi:hypothetical protein
MQPRVARRFRRGNPRPVGPWALLGFGAGLAAGFVLGEVFGGGGSQRIGRLVGGLRRKPVPERPSDRATTILAVLEAEPELSGLRFSLVPAAGGGLELRGWVPTRAARSRAMRLAHAASGGLAILDRLLVRGEDDAAPSLVLDDEPRSA